MYLLNAFSLNMLEIDEPVIVEIIPATTDAAKGVLEDGFTSAVGHKDTAAVLENMLGMPVECNRVNVKLEPGESAIVAQYRGPRLPEGATKLPEGAEIEFYLVNRR